MPTDAPASHPWFDAHLDLAFLAETGRDMHRDPDFSPGRYRPAAITLPSLAEGRVTRCLATIFTEAIDPADPNADTAAHAYPRSEGPDDSASRLAAWKAGQRQLRLYHAWRDAGLISIEGLEPVAEAPLSARILMENADPIESPDQLHEWADAGVLVIGLCWAVQGRYAAGNAVDPAKHKVGLTPEGKDLVRRMDALGITHDASHLNDRSLADLFETTDQPIIASHSNARALNDDNQRHLTDEAIKEIINRGGVVGLNLLNSFIAKGVRPEDRPSIAQAIDHVEHICAIAGNREQVGLGSDMDGGITALRLPEGIGHPRDLDKLADELARRDWSDANIAAFMHGNWDRYFERADAARAALAS